MQRRAKRKRPRTFRNTAFKKPRRTGGRPFIPGVNRTAGFYGRYSGPTSELKFHDVDVDHNPINTAGIITPSINIIPQGTTESQRIGRKCTIKSIGWKVRFQYPELDGGATPQASDDIRLILYLDKQANGAAASVLDLIETADVRSFRNLANSGRFVFLHDKLYTINVTNLASDAAGVVSSGGVRRNFSVYKKCNLPIEFSSTTGAIGEIRSNNLGVMAMTGNGLTILDSTFRLRFSDGS